PQGARAVASVPNGEISNLAIEAVFLDPSTGAYGLGNVFGTISRFVGDNNTITIPDLYADTNGDGTIGAGDILYSEVDLNAYLRNVPNFSLGDIFNIVNGTVNGLTGMQFSTTPFVFDASTGAFNGAPFNGTGVAMSTHDLTPIPEPRGIFPLSLCLIGLA